MIKNKEAKQFTSPLKLTIYTKANFKPRNNNIKYIRMISKVQGLMVDVGDQIIKFRKMKKNKNKKNSKNQISFTVLNSLV